jgi:hypothetical protein
MALADDLSSDIAEVLDDPDFGRNVTLRRTVAGAYDPATGATAAATVTDYSSRGLILGYKDSLINGTLIRQGDRKCILKSLNLGTVPEETDGLIVPQTLSAFRGTSASSLAIGGGAKVFVTQAGKSWPVGSVVRATYDADNYMEGLVTAYAGTSLTIEADVSFGAGTHAAWTIAAAERYAVLPFKTGELGGTPYLYVLQIRK